jgi:hypothetical protein
MDTSRAADALLRSPPRLVGTTAGTHVQWGGRRVCFGFSGGQICGTDGLRSTMMMFRAGRTGGFPKGWIWIWMWRGGWDWLRFCCIGWVLWCPGGLDWVDRVHGTWYGVHSPVRRIVYNTPSTIRGLSYGCRISTNGLLVGWLDLCLR